MSSLRERAPGGVPRHPNNTYIDLDVKKTQEILSMALRQVWANPQPDGKTLSEDQQKLVRFEVPGFCIQIHPKCSYSISGLLDRITWPNDEIIECGVLSMLAGSAMPLMILHDNRLTLKTGLDQGTELSSYSLLEMTKDVNKDQEYTLMLPKELQEAAEKCKFLFVSLSQFHMLKMYLDGSHHIDLLHTITLLRKQCFKKLQMVFLIHNNDAGNRFGIHWYLCALCITDQPIVYCYDKSEQAYNTCQTLVNMFYMHVDPVAQTILPPNLQAIVYDADDYTINDGNNCALIAMVNMLNLIGISEFYADENKTAEFFAGNFAVNEAGDFAVCRIHLFCMIASTMATKDQFDRLVAGILGYKSLRSKQGVPEEELMKIVQLLDAPHAFAQFHGRFLGTRYRGMFKDEHAKFGCKQVSLD